MIKSKDEIKVEGLKIRIKKIKGLRTNIKCLQTKIKFKKL